MSNECGNNSYIILGLTGVGKSTLCRVLSEDKTIKIGESTDADSCTVKASSYECHFQNFNYTVIDTPGFLDTKGEQQDKLNLQYLKDYLSISVYNIKGIIIILNFQDNKFLKYHEKSLKKIIGLIPLPNFWDYVTIFFSHTYCSKKQNLEEEKKKKLIALKEKFEKLMLDAENRKGVKKINFDNIKKKFFDIDAETDKKEDEEISDLIRCIERTKNFEPLFHSVIRETFTEKKLLYQKGNIYIMDVYKLFECKYKKIIFVNKYGKELYTHIRLIDSKFIKDIKEPLLYEDLGVPLKSEEEQFKAFVYSSLGLYAGANASIFICPPLAIPLWFLAFGLSIPPGIVCSKYLISGILNYIKNILNYKECLDNNYEKVYKLEEKDEYDDDELNLY